MNPLLSPAENAELAALRSNSVAHVPESAFRNIPALSRTAQFIQNRDYSKAFPYATNGMALAFVGFYALNVASIAGGGNHIYMVYGLFPVIASIGITLAMWSLPDDSLLRLFYLVGLFVISWLGA